MDTPPAPTWPEAEPPKIPEELLKKVHEANAELHEAKQQVETAIDGTGYRHQQRISDKLDQFQRVDQEAEKIDEQVQKAIEPPR